jgi:hypothetical protein
MVGAQIVNASLTPLREARRSLWPMICRLTRLSPAARRGKVHPGLVVMIARL